MSTMTPETITQRAIWLRPGDRLVGRYIDGTNQVEPMDVTVVTSREIYLDNGCTRRVLKLSDGSQMTVRQSICFKVVK